MSVTDAVIKRTDDTYIIVLSYGCAPATETTGYKAGRTLSHVGAVGGVDATSTFETFHDTDNATKITEYCTEIGSCPITAVAVEGVTLKEDVVSLKKEHKKKSVECMSLLTAHDTVKETEVKIGCEICAVTFGYM